MPKAVLTIKDKVGVIEVYKNEKLSVRELAKKFNISKTQAACIIKNKDQILRLWDTDVNPDRKKSLLSPKGLNIDKLCYEWFVKARNKNIPLSGTLIRGKAKEIAEKLNYADFSASSGWLERFKKRHNICFRAISGEAASVNPDDVKSFAEKVPSLIQGYDLRDIYNADETGLFFRALPDKTFSLKGEKCVGGKMSKDRLTILHCVNMAGEKESLFVIGKAARPRAFRNINLNNLPVTWRSNRKAWMTSELMTDFLIQFDRKMKFQERNVLLFLDNAASHPRDLKLKNVKIIFLPANTTAFCQPLDQGIIRNFKFLYKSFFIKNILSQMEDANSASELSKSTNLLDVVYFMHKAWDQVSQQTIKNCFKKAGFTKTIVPSDEIGWTAEDELPLSALAQFSNIINRVQSEIVQVNVEDYINLDNEVLTNDEDVENISTEIVFPSQETLPISSEDEEESEIDGKLTSYKEAYSSIGKLKAFSLSHNDLKGVQLLTDFQIHLQEIEIKGKTRQAKISDYFKSN